MVEFYSKEIFRIMEYDLDDEIPVEEFKNKIFEGTDEERKFLCMFCCADLKDEKKTGFVFSPYDSTD